MPLQNIQQWDNILPPAPQEPVNGFEPFTPLDRQAASVAALTGDQWHNKICSLTGSYVSKGLSDAEIHSLTAGFTLSGYTADQTNAEVQKMIDGARRKGFDQAAQASPQKSDQPVKKILTMISDIEIKDPKYLIEETIETPSVVGLVGPSGSCKTMKAIDKGMSIATGTPYHGLAVEKGLVIMSAGEGHSGIPRRIEAWCNHHGQDITLANFALTSCAVSLFDETYMTAFCSEVDELASRLGKPKLIIINTVARHMSGLDENSARDTGALIATADKLKNDYGCVVMLVHHTGHANQDRARGSTAFKGALDTEILVKSLGENDVIVSCEKQKDGAPFAARQFLKVPLGKSMILQQVENNTKASRKTSPSDRYALDSLSVTFNEISRSSAHVDQWRPNFYAGHPADSPDAKRKAFNRARQSLINNGLVDCKNDKYTLRDSGT